MINCNFPLITYDVQKKPHENGLMHGEEFRNAIKELVQIRTHLMQEKNKNLNNSFIKEESQRQLKITQEYDSALYEELCGIAQGAGLDLSDIIVLNNYTDFRDINFQDEGCSAVYINKNHNGLLGQTWDMHKSAMHYVCLINIPGTEESPGLISFSLVGCIGMMGYNSHGIGITVNNINTLDATSGVIWPAFIRKTLQAKTFSQTTENVKNTPFTSGHAYLIADKDQCYNWEATPSKQEIVTQCHHNNYTYHTNHCLSEVTAAIENKGLINSTTYDRQKLLEQHLPQITCHAELKDLFQSHENYPKSICSHYQSSAQDPAFTCGGALGSFQENIYEFWRTCPRNEELYSSYKFTLKEHSFNLL